MPEPICSDYSVLNKNTILNNKVSDDLKEKPKTTMTTTNDIVYTKILDTVFKKDDDDTVDDDGVSLQFVFRGKIRIESYKPAIDEPDGVAKLVVEYVESDSKLIEWRSKDEIYWKNTRLPSNDIKGA